MASRKSGKPEPSAHDRALALLARREHSAREIKQRLAARGHDDDESERALTDLQRSHYQSDERFAEVLIRARVGAGYGPRYIEAELRSHRIDPRPHRAALAEHDWAALAKTLVRRRYGARLDTREVAQKAAQFLARRGFPGAAVARATRVEVGDETE